MSTPSWIPSIIKERQSLSPYTTIKVGGIARFFSVVHTVEDLLECIRFSQQQNLPLFVIGKGSNLILGDGCIDAVFVVNRIGGVLLKEDRVEVGAGVNASYLSQKVSKMGYGGLEFFSGIPGTVGGCVVMNAGAQQKEVSDVLLEVETIDPFGNFSRYSRGDLEFGYRTSPFKGNKEVIVSLTFKVYEDQKAEEKRVSILKKRLDTQPYTVPTAGCMFKNPKGASAGQLIDQCGLKGLEIGGVKVSSKHANFFENNHNATAQNVLDLVERVRYEVKIKTGIDLELEVIPCFTTCTPTLQHPTVN